MTTSINILQANSITAHSTNTVSTGTAQASLSPKLVILCEQPLVTAQKAIINSVSGVDQILDFDDSFIKTDIATLLKTYSVLIVDMTNDNYSKWYSSQTNYIVTNTDAVKVVYYAKTGEHLDDERWRNIQASFKCNSYKKASSFPDSATSWAGLVTNLLSKHVSKGLVNKGGACAKIMKMVVSCVAQAKQ